MKISFLGLLLLIGVASQAADMSCRFVDAGCDLSAKCYYKRLQLGCEGTNGFIQDNVIPTRINVYQSFQGPSGKVLSKPLSLTNDEGLTLVDIYEPSAKAAAWARKNGIALDIEKMGVHLNESTPIYKNAVTRDTYPPRNSQSTGKYTCVWKSYPSLITSTCNKAKAFCMGDAVCKGKDGIAFDAGVDCLDSKAGDQCADASACANSEDSKEVGEIKKCAGTPLVVSGGRSGPNGSTIKGTP